MTQERASMTHHRPVADPLSELVADHEVISEVLDSLETVMERDVRLGAFATSFYDLALTFLADFADRSHHGKEEECLFPLLEEHGIPRAGGPIGCLLGEHEIGRDCVRAARAALEGARRGDAGARAIVHERIREYVDLLREHILKENEVLFAMAERVMPLDAMDELARRFEALEKAQGGAAGRDRYFAMARSMERLATAR
jgi:hemerythrin-like domain-containing protein